MATTTLTPQADTYRGSWVIEWLTTVDHKKIGILYILNSFFFFFAAGILALVIRSELAVPGPAVPGSGHLQPGLHHARDDHDLPVRGAGPVRLRELRGAAAAGRAGHGLPAHQCPLLLAPATRWPADLRRLPVRRGRGRGLDRVHPTQQRHLRAGRRHRPVADRPDAGGHRLDPGRGQLHHHHLQDAGAGDDALPHADLRLDGPRHRHADPARHAGADRRHDRALHRSQLRGPLLRSERRRQPDPVAAPLLVLRPSGGVHRDPAGDGRGERDPARLQPHRCSGIGPSSSPRSPSASSASACGRTTCSPPARSSCRSSAS